VNIFAMHFSTNFIAFEKELLKVFFSLTSSVQRFFFIPPSGFPFFKNFDFKTFCSLVCSGLREREVKSNNCSLKFMLQIYVKG
jgi:hypothetical protein